MAIDKDPSIYRDRGMIGSSDELDEYGVWVKSEPQVLRADSSSSSEPLEPALPDIEDLPDLDLDIETTESTLSADGSVSDFDLDDIPSMDIEESGERILGADTLSEESFTELSMDDFLDTTDIDLENPSLGGDPHGHEVEEEPLDIDLHFSEEPLPAVSPTSEPEEINIDIGGDAGSDSEIAASIETVTDFDDFLDELSDSSSTKEDDASVDELNIDIAGDAQEDTFVAQPSESEEVSVDLSSSDGYPEMEDAVDIGDHFDDVGAVGDDLREETGYVHGKSDLSTELLMRIADELSSIKTEISSLKSELSVLRSTARVTEGPIEAPRVAEQEAAHGFFDEEDDEKIALTGDELDNILNTADFTEEAGADAGEDADGSEDVESASFLSDRPDIFGDETDDASETHIEEDAIPPELAELQESGVVPMTEAPEDTSYLEAEGIIEPLDLSDSIDLTEAVIEEPDLGNIVLEEPLMEEPTIDSIDIDLEMEESLHTEEITLPIENKEESFEEILPEGFIVESEEEPNSIDVSADLEDDIEVVDFDDSDVNEVQNREDAPSIAEEVPADPETPVTEESAGAKPAAELPQNLRTEVKAVLSYMDQLLESLPESKIEEFAQSEYFETYKKLFEELGLA